MMNTKVSVVMPVYNKEKYLEECIESLLSQTLKDIEIIAINDFSTDNSYRLLLEYAAKDERLIVLNNPYNLGAARTRNIGMNIARGKYVAVLDADDYFDEHFLEDMYIEGERTNSDVILCDYTIVGGDDTQEKVSSILSKYSGMIDKPCTPGIFSDNLFSIWSVAPWSKLCRLSYIMDNNIFFQDLENSNDVYWGIMVLAKSERISFIPKDYTFHRRGIEGQITQYRGKNPYCANKAFEKIHRELMLTNKYEMFEDAFALAAVSVFNYQYECACEPIKSEYKKYIKDIGLKKLGLSWEGLKADNGKDILDVSRCGLKKYESYDKMLLWLADRGYKAALWGWGKLGTGLLKNCKNKQAICEIYDIDKSKHGVTNERLTVTDLEHGRKDIDVIIVTNTRFTEKIIEKILECKKEYLKIVEMPVLEFIDINPLDLLISVRE